MKQSTFYLVLTILASCAVACSLFPDTPEDNTLLDGPISGLSHEQHIRFIAGDVAFNDEVFTPDNGLGPIFVATSCGSCHLGDGKGHPFTSLVRFGQPDEYGNQYLEQGGPQLQHRAIPGYSPEQIPSGATFSKLIPPANTGLGYLEAIPDEVLMALADPDDEDGDGISGVPNWVSLPNYVKVRPGAISQSGSYIGRFGKKAAVYDLLQQTVTAYNQDIGISSSYEPVDPYTGLEIDPEISNQTVLDVVFYLQTLKAPLPRYSALEGEDIFEAIGCGKCHVSELTTGSNSIKVLANQTIRPYTDLLLHDMGAALDDGYSEGSAKTYEWRTPPLWGLGLSRNSQGGSYFLMHDGRAHSIEEAILMHGGEGLNSSQAYQNLSVKERTDLIRFLESL